MFGWATSGWDNTAVDRTSIHFHPWDTATSYTVVDIDYNTNGYGPAINNPNPNITGTYYDWGEFNAIYNPATGKTDAPGTWYTITYNEWLYLVGQRANASDKYGWATVNGVRGLVMIPDLWIQPEGVSFYHSAPVVNEDCYERNKYNSTQWQKMEDAGATFLPAAGYRSRTRMISIGDFGDYHSSTAINSYENYIPYFTTWSFNESYSLSPAAGSRWYGRAVRLIKEFEE